MPNYNIEFSESFYKALDYLSTMSDDKITLEILITDDGCVLEIKEE